MHTLLKIILTRLPWSVVEPLLLDLLEHLAEKTPSKLDDRAVSYIRKRLK